MSTSGRGHGDPQVYDAAVAMKLSVAARSFADRFVGRSMKWSDLLVVSGFWRSGTTWVMRLAGDMLGARTVFEPLSPKSGALTVTGTEGHAPGGRSGREIYMPCVSVDGDLEEWAAAALVGAARGAFSDAWTQRERRGYATLFSGTVVLKEVRLSLCLPWLQECMPGCGVLHVMRDPRSVIAGILRRPGWAAGAFEDIDLNSQLIDRQVRCGVFDAALKERLSEYERASAVERLAAYWCATQHVAVKALGRKNGRYRVVSYERLVLEWEKEMCDTLATMGYARVRGSRVRSDATTTTDPNRRDISAQARLSSWRSTLTGGQVESVERVVHRFGMQSWLYQ